MRNLYLTTLTTLPGINWIGRMVNRTVRLDADCYKTSKAATQAAISRANFGAPIQNRFAVLVLKKIPGKGYRVVDQVDGEVWDDR